MDRPPRRPRLPDGTTESLSRYLRAIPYGEEDEQVLQSIPIEVLERELSWHEQFRVWLRTNATHPNLLPLILAQLQACVLQADDTTLLWGDGDTTWKQDAMIQHWGIARHFVERQVKALALNRQDGLDAQRILRGIDQLALNVHDSCRRTPQDVLQDYKSDKNRTQRNMKEADMSSVDECQEFLSWVTSHLNKDHGEVRELLLEAIERAPQWRVRRTLSELPQDLVQAGDIRSNRRRGQALLASFLKEKGGCTLAPVPTIESSESLLSVMRSYLCNEKSIPNVRELALAIWDHHLTCPDGILEMINAYISWLPIEPITARYRNMLADCFGHGNTTFMTRQVLRATDMACALIGSEAEEWREVFTVEMCQNTLLPLVHEFFFDEMALGKIALLGVLLERIMQHNGGVLNVCTQLGWVIFLCSDLPTRNDYERRLIYQFGSLYSRVIKTMKICEECCFVASAILPPLSAYVDSALVACALSRDIQTTAVWVRHVVMTLSRYQQCDDVATEWLSCMVCTENIEDCRTKYLHGQVCQFLWGRNAQDVPKRSVGNLLAENDNNIASRVLLATPPDCLFAQEEQEDVASLLGQLLAAFGTCVGVIVVGMALKIAYMQQSEADCRGLLYQHLRNVLASGKDLEGTFKWIERELLPYPQSLQWWKTLKAELVRNECAANASGHGSPGFDTSLELVEELFSKGRKRAREDTNDTHEDAAPPEKVQARTGASATEVLRKLLGDTARPPVEAKPSPSAVVDVALHEEEFPAADNNDDVQDGSEDDHHDENDDRILLL